MVERYYRYMQRVLFKESRFFARREATGRYSYACPGNIGHMAKLKHKPFNLFDRWCDREPPNRRGARPQKAYGLYWRTHPEQE
jgi:hypothetical protein